MFEVAFNEKKRDEIRHKYIIDFLGGLGSVSWRMIDINKYYVYTYEVDIYNRIAEEFEEVASIKKVK